MSQPGIEKIEPEKRLFRRISNKIKRINCTVPEWAWNFYKQIGHGVFSKGLRILARKAIQIEPKAGRPRKKPKKPEKNNTHSREAIQNG